MHITWIEFTVIITAVGMWIALLHVVIFTTVYCWFLTRELMRRLSNGKVC